MEVLTFAGAKGSIDIGELLAELARREIVSLLVEGGGRTHGAFLASGLVDEVRLFISPMLLGEGPAWMTMPAERAPSRVAEAPRLVRPTVEEVGDDLLLVTRPGANPGDSG